MQYTLTEKFHLAIRNRLVTTMCLPLSDNAHWCALRACNAAFITRPPMTSPSSRVHDSTKTSLSLLYSWLLPFQQHTLTPNPPMTMPLCPRASARPPKASSASLPALRLQADTATQSKRKTGKTQVPQRSAMCLCVCGWVLTINSRTRCSACTYSACSLGDYKKI